MIPLAIYTPLHLTGNQRPPLEQFGYRFLAEGDSWFSIGALNPAKNSSLLFEMEFEVSACAVNCAFPGDTLGHMGDLTADPHFAALLFGKRAETWDAILLSAGGNDLIDAMSAQGPDVPPARRLLLRANEWGDAASGPVRYISEEGWATFSTYLGTCLAAVIKLRERGPSRGVPIFMHGYAVPTPRPSGAGLGAGPWLLPSLVAYGIPASDHVALARLFIERLGALLAAFAADTARFPNLHVFDSARIDVTPSAPDATGDDGDWANEIHLNSRGYEKIAQPWCAAIAAVLDAR